jgi:BirA family transcriptional regulator, biotin operon repressor / biotin---[acetyl-CoA-carboxylase] ligase
MPLDAQRVQSLRPQNPIHYFSTVSSTMTEAVRLAHEGAPHGTAVIAEEQTAGLGRFGRKWMSEAEAGIYSSILLRLPLPSNQFPLISLLLALATAQAIQKSTPLTCDLRWPNDVLINENKVAGILPQLVDACIVAGIGINVNNTIFEPGFRTPATSPKIVAGGQDISREVVLVNLLESIDTFSHMLTSGGPTAILDAFAQASTYVANRKVLIEDSGIRGITAGLDENGFLLVRSEGGKLERVAAGGVRPAA